MSNFENEILEAVRVAVKEVYDIEPDEKVLAVETPRDKKMGDYSTSVAMRLAKQLHKAPIQIGEPLVAYLQEHYDGAESVTLVKPGFINFKMKASALSSIINTVIDAKDNYGKSDAGKGEKVLVEYVSANPTGNLHCGHARGAAWGDALTRILSAAGYDVLREYYVNDAGHQIEMLAESMLSRYYALFDQEYPLPEDGYHGKDIIEVAEKIKEKDGDKWLNADVDERMKYFMDEGIEMKLDQIRKDLDLFRVGFDSWMHERFFYEDNAKRINDVLKTMEEKGLTYEKDDALWFKATEYGDDKDRVLRKSTGLLTYLTPDIANHVYKYERGYTTLINLWGADHHSYVVRMKCALSALGYNPESLVVDLMQMVRMVDNGVEVKMSKRTGNAITIRELCEDIGVDAARWFFVSKDANTQMDFDMNLARTKSNDNPVYYAQYAYSRMNSIVTRQDMPKFEKVENYDLLTDEKELQLMKLVSEFPAEVAGCASSRKPNRMTDYIISLVKVFHSYYNSCHVYNPDNLALTNQRLGLIHAVMITLKNALDLVGVSAPEKM